MFEHITVMLEEAVEGLNIKENGIYVDCTLGGGGHSSLILSKLTTGHLYAFDQDTTAIKAATKKLSAISDNFTIIHSNFVDLKEKLNELGVHRVDGVLFDLGVSSPQFDTPERGFSYNYDARLDMRMNQEQSLDAYQIVNEYEFEQIVRILRRYSDEKFAKQIARKIEARRNVSPIETTFELVDIVKDAIPAPARRKGGHPAKRTFQALRIAVNDELSVFERALEQALEIINVEGRVSVITFHSLEDRICKSIFKEKTTTKDIPGLPIMPEHLKAHYKLINKKAYIATESELEQNNRAHSAKLRVIERIIDDEKE